MKKKVRQAVIIAGGLGSRLRPFTNKHPKPLYPVAGQPFLAYLFRQLSAWGFEEALLLLGYMAEQIIEYVGKNPVKELRVTCDLTPVDFDTAGRLTHAREKLDDAFLLLYCDNYCPIDYPQHEADFWRNKALVQLVAYTNHDGYTKSNLRVDETGKVMAYDKKRLTPNLAGVDIGYALVRKKTLDFLPPDSADVNFEAYVYPCVLEKGLLFASTTEHRYYSIGGWERMPLTERFFSNPPTIFLDRDGTLNVRPPKACYVEKPEEFIWLPGAREAVAAFKQRGWRVIIVSNQPGIARGKLTEATLAAIHIKMQTELRESGGEIDAIYYCPHGWDEECACRKPNPGMLYQAQKDFCLDLTKCLLIGDDERDIEAGEVAGCRCVRVSGKHALLTAAMNLLEELHR